MFCQYLRGTFLTAPKSHAAKEDLSFEKLHDASQQGLGKAPLLFHKQIPELLKFMKIRN